MDAAFADALDIINRGGVVALLVAASMALYLGLVVPRRTSDRIIAFWRERWEHECEEKAEWKALATSSVEAVERLAKAQEDRNRLDLEARAR